MPLVDVMTRTLDATLREAGCLFGISIFLPDLVGEQERQNIVVPRSSTLLKQAMESRETDILLHTIHPGMVRALVRETVAYDFHSSRSDRPDTYGTNAPGTYVVALSIEGRHGAFLTRLETESLVEHLEEYAAALDKWDRATGVWADSQAGRDAKRVVATVEAKHFKGKGPGLAEDPRSRIMIDYLVAMFKKRINAQLDPAGDTPQRQSPLMVGETTKTFQEEMAQHDVMVEGPGGTTHTWALTIMCIENCLDLRVEVCCKPVVLAFKPGHVELSEVLVTTLGRSIVTQRGYNITAPGSRLTPASLDVELYEQIASSHCTWFGESLKLSLRYVDDLAKVQHAIKTLEDFRQQFETGQDTPYLRLVDIEKPVLDVTSRLTEMQKQHVQMRQKLADAIKLRDELRKKVQELDDEEKVARALNVALHAFKRRRDAAIRDAGGQGGTGGGDSGSGSASG
jgi:hypothetical protein